MVAEPMSDLPPTYSPYPVRAPLGKRGAGPAPQTVLLITTSYGNQTKVEMRTTGAMSEKDALDAIEQICARRSPRFVDINGGDKVVQISEREVAIFGDGNFFFGPRTTRVQIGTLRS